MLGFANNFNVSILDTVLEQDSTAPVSTAAHNLCIHSALVSAGLGVQGLKGMLNIFSARIFRSLNCNKVFIRAIATLKQEPIDTLIPLVLVTLNKVPTEDEVLCNIIHSITNQSHGNIMPRHSAIFCLAQFVTLPLLHTLEIHDTIVVEFLAREDIVLEVRRMSISQWMLVSIPSPEAQIDTTNESQCIIDDDEFLMVSPVQGDVCGIFEDVVIRVAQDLDVPMARGPFRAEAFQGMLGMGRIAGKSLVDLLVHNNVNLHTSFGPTLEHLVQSPFLIEKRRPPQEQFRRDPPVCQVDHLLGLVQGSRDSPEVVQSIDIPLEVVVLADRSERLEPVGLCDTGSLVVRLLFMLFIVTMVGVDNIEEFSELVLHVVGFFVRILQMGLCTFKRIPVSMFFGYCISEIRAY